MIWLFLCKPASGYVILYNLMDRERYLIRRREVWGRILIAEKEI